eukprot:TRINITY_DN6758_c0_g1_i1.p1 TRINITY_DN6758_c0_g1~~TRINITY_DN6758_c0_g1_i1.p1  ORF type:complete len:893 (+),score=85.72 TRINITY_DN6758_c0_g1_i1:44-2722(+)
MHSPRLKHRRAKKLHGSKAAWEKDQAQPTKAPTRSSNFPTLYDELVAHILLFLPWRALCSSSLVSRKWQRLGGAAWTRIVFPEVPSWKPQYGRICKSALAFRGRARYNTTFPRFRYGTIPLGLPCTCLLDDLVVVTDVLCPSVAKVYGLHLHEGTGGISPIGHLFCGANVHYMSTDGNLLVVMTESGGTLAYNSTMSLEWKISFDTAPCAVEFSKERGIVVLCGHEAGRHHDFVAVLNYSTGETLLYVTLSEAVVQLYLPPAPPNAVPGITWLLIETDHGVHIWRFTIRKEMKGIFMYHDPPARKRLEYCSVEFVANHVTIDHEVFTEVANEPTEATFSREQGVYVLAMPPNELFFGVWPDNSHADVAPEQAAPKVFRVTLHTFEQVEYITFGKVSRDLYGACGRGAAGLTGVFVLQRDDLSERHSWLRGLEEEEQICSVEVSEFLNKVLVLTTYFNLHMVSKDTLLQISQVRCHNCVLDDSHLLPTIQANHHIVVVGPLPVQQRGLFTMSDSTAVVFDFREPTIVRPERDIRVARSLPLPRCVTCDNPRTPAELAWMRADLVSSVRLTTTFRERMRTVPWGFGGLLCGGVCAFASLKLDNLGTSVLGRYSFSSVLPLYWVSAALMLWHRYTILGRLMAAPARFIERTWKRAFSRESGKSEAAPQPSRPHAWTSVHEGALLLVDCYRDCFVPSLLLMKLDSAAAKPCPASFGFALLAHRTSWVGLALLWHVGGAVQTVLDAYFYFQCSKLHSRFPSLPLVHASGVDLQLGVDRVAVTCALILDTTVEIFLLLWAIWAEGTVPMPASAVFLPFVVACALVALCNKRWPSSLNRIPTIAFYSVLYGIPVLGLWFRMQGIYQFPFTVITATWPFLSIGLFISTVLDWYWKTFAKG